MHVDVVLTCCLTILLLVLMDVAIAGRSRTPRPEDGCVAGACVTCKAHVPSTVGGIAVSCELTAGDVTCLRLCDRNGCSPWECF